jgi:transcriptional regulator with XRE-family HTH domain
MNSINQKIGAALKTQREASGLSVIELAKASGVTKTTIYRIESGEFLPNTLLLWKIANSLSCEIQIINVDNKNILNNL